MTVETFANLPSTTVSSGGTTAPSPGTVQTWTVASSAGFPAASSGASPPTQFHIADPADDTEIIAVTNISGTAWTVTRGAEGSAPVTHAAGFAVNQVVSAGAYGGFAQLPAANTWTGSQYFRSGSPWYDVKAYGATGNGTTDDTAAIQAAISAQQGAGGTVFLPPGTYLVNGATSGAGLICAPGTGGAWTNATRPLIIRGSGRDNTTILSGNQWQFGGLLTSGSSGVSVNSALLDMADVTLDGNCSLNGGTLAQPASNGGGLVSLPWPYTNATSSPARNGLYHLFTRVRFYRPTGYGFQPVQGVKCVQCDTLNGGQPSASVTHYDNFGSGQADAIILGHVWKDSTGNYCDFVATSGIIRLIMIGCESYNHTAGGVYGCGNGSIIAGNNLDSGSGGIGYDVGTANGLKSGNLVANNVCPSLAVKGSLSFHSYGDLVYGNISSDQSSAGNVDVAGNLVVQNALILGTVTNTPTGSPSFTSDGANMYFAGTGAGGSRVYFRPSGYTSSTGQLSLDTTGLLYVTGPTATTATAGSQTLPASPVGFLEVNIGGTTYKLPYYAV